MPNVMPGMSPLSADLNDELHANTTVGCLLLASAQKLCLMDTCMRLPTLYCTGCFPQCKVFQRDRHALFGSPEKNISDSEISCENGCNVSEQRRCKTCVPVSGPLPDAGWQVSDLLLLLDHWVKLLLLRGHQGERGLGIPKKEEDSLNPETRCQEERRASEEEAQCFNC